jgi:hypothetical protein
MDGFIVTVKFLGCLILLFALGHLVGLLLRLDKFHPDNPEGNNEASQEGNN